MAVGGIVISRMSGVFINLFSVSVEYSTNGELSLTNKVGP